MNTISENPLSDKTFIPMTKLELHRRDAKNLAKRYADETGKKHSIRTFYRGPRRNDRDSFTYKADATHAFIAIYCEILPGLPVLYRYY